MTNAILRGLRSLHLFPGRDTAGQFWPYAAVVVTVTILVMGAGMSFAIQGLLADMQQFAADHPEATTIERSATSYSMSIDASHPDVPQLDLAPAFGVMAGVVALTAVLLAAAVSRRLHDCNRPAWLGLVPVIFLTSGLVLFPRMMDEMVNSAEPSMGLFGLLFLNNILYLVTLAALILQCALRGTAGPNRYGPAPMS